MTWPGGSEAEPPDRSRAGWYTGASRFVGRTREFDALRARLDAAHFGKGGTVMLAGEAGIGKTRLAHEFAAHARSYEIPVFWGRCYEGDWSPPFAPWVEALAAAARHFDAPVLHEASGGGAATLARLVPAIRERFPAIELPAALSPGDERFRLYDAVGELCLRLAAPKPIVLVLDDLHWADAASIGLLAHLSRFAGNSNLLIVGAYRDTEIGRGHPLDDLIANLRRDRSFQFARLRGLRRGDVARFIETGDRSALPARLAEAIASETNGNPFFVEEVIRHLTEEGKLPDQEAPPASLDLPSLGIPDGVRQLVRKRLARLSAATNRMLAHAVVFTGGFDFALLQELTAIPEDDLLDAVDEALAAHLIEAVPHAGETYDFVHAIVRHTLYDEWSPSRRVRLHRRLAEAIERVAAGREMERASELAAQYHASSSLPGAERGIRYALAAVERARSAYAHEQAVTFLRMARDLSIRAEPGQRAEVLTRLVIAEADALDLDDAIATTEEALAALDTANASPSAIAAFLARAAAALKDGGAPTASWLRLVERGLALTPADDKLTWARLMLLPERFEPVATGVIHASRWVGTDPRAVEWARSLGDEDDYARTLQPFDGKSDGWTDDLAERLTLWQRPTAIVRALIIAGADWLYHAGDLTRAVDHFQELQRVAERHGSILGLAESQVRLAVAFTALGDFTAAQDAEARARDLVARFGPGHRLHASAAWITALHAEYLGGDWPGIAAYWTRVVGDPRLGERTIGLDDAALAALAHARAGAEPDARAMLEALTPVVAAMEPSLWLLNGAVDFGAAAVWALGAAQFAPAYRAAAVALIEAGHGDYPGGSHELTVARMDALLGRHQEAETYFARARLRLEERGQRPLRAIVDLDEALALARAGRGDPLRREHLLTTALTTFRELGMAPWIEQAEAALSQTPKPRERRGDARPGGLTDREIEVVRLVVRGYSDRQISDDLYVSPRTVNAHIRNILAKADCGNRTELSVWAVERGVIHDEETAPARGSPAPGSFSTRRMANPG